MAGAQTQETLSLTSEKMADVMTKELREGCIDDPSIKCGFIGEVGCSFPLHGDPAFSIKEVLWNLHFFQILKGDQSKRRPPFNKWKIVQSAFIPDGILNLHLKS